MKSSGQKRHVERLCAAVVMACVLSPASAREPIAEQDPSVRAPASAPGTTNEGAGERKPANGPDAASKPCPPAGNRDGQNAPGGGPTVLRELVCWWQDGVARQSRALIP